MFIETELKLSLAPEYAEQLMQHPLLQSASHSLLSQHLYNTYFDTSKCELLQYGVGLRVRHIGDKRVQTLKTTGVAHGGLHQRQEWENEITGDIPNYSQFPKDVLPAVCAKKPKKIKGLFTTDFIRITWNLSLDDGSKIEVALDQGEIKTQTASIPLNEVELELKAGTPDVLYKVALTLQKTLPLFIENKSKAQRGYALYQPQPIQFYKAGAVKLSADITTEQAFIHIIWHCIEQMQANEDMVLYGEDIEGVHQMRVATRRLRSCLNFYKPLIPKEIYKKIGNEIKWFADVLGVARDWDVFALNLQNIQAPHRTAYYQEIEDLKTQVADFQRQAYVTVHNALRSPRYSCLLLSLGKWLSQRRWRRNLDTIALQHLDGSVKNFASQRFKSYFQQVRQKGKHFSQLNFEQLHALRITVKKMAYGCHFFADIYSQKTVRSYAQNLSLIQDELGVFNDMYVATDLLNQAGLDENAPARHFLKGWYAHQQVVQQVSLKAAWQNFLDENIFW